MTQPQLVATAWTSATIDCSAAKALSTFAAWWLRDKGFDGPWGVEILSSSFRRLPVAQAVKQAVESARTVL